MRAETIPPSSRSRTEHATVALRKLLEYLAFAANLVAALLVLMAVSGETFGLLSGLERLDVEQQMLLAAVAGGGAVLLTVLAYLLSFLPPGAKRPYRRIFFLTASCTLIGTVFVDASLLAEEFQDLGLGRLIITVPAGLLAMAAPVLLIYGLERMLGWLFFGLAQGPVKLEWWSWAEALLRAARLFLPLERQLYEQLGMIWFKMDRLELAAPALRGRWERGDRDLELVEALAEVIPPSEPDFRAQVLLDLIGRMNGRRDLVDRLIAHYRAVGKNREALELLDQYASKTKLDDLWLYEELLSEGGQTGKALELIRQILERQPSALTEARERAAALLRTYPEDVEILRLSAELALKDEDWGKAVVFLEQLCILQPQDAPARLSLIRTYRSANRFEDTIEHYRILLEQAPPSADLMREYVETLEGLGREAEALETARQALSDYPGAVWFYSLLAAHHFAEEQFDAALELIAAGLEQATEHGDTGALHTLKSKIEEKLRELELERLSRAYENEPDNLELFFEYFDKLIANDRAQRAVSDLGDLLERKPEFRPRILEKLDQLNQGDQPPYATLSFKADLLLEERQCDAALDIFRRMAGHSLHADKVIIEGCKRIMQVDRDHYESHRQLALIALQNEDWTVAANHLHVCERVSPEKFKPLLPELFRVYVQLDDLERAAFYGKLAVEADPRNKQFYLDLARLLAAHDKYSIALQWIARARKFEPSDRELFDLQKSVEEQQRKNRIIELRDLLDQQPDHPEYNLEQANFFFNQRKFGDAIPLYGKAKSKPEYANLAQAKIALCWAHKGMFDLAEESIGEIDFTRKDTDARLDDLKPLLYDLALIFTEEQNFEQAREFYKRVYKIDAGYRDVVDKIEDLARRIARKKQHLPQNAPNS